MSGTLIFVETMAERDAALVLFEGICATTPETAISMLSEGRTVVAGRWLEMGWRAPIGTHIIFSARFPKDGPYRAQAEARVVKTPVATAEVLRSARLEGYVLCFSGTLAHMTRAEAKAYAESLG